jgi:hypothetical protein
MALSKWMDGAGGLGQGFIDIEINHQEGSLCFTFLRKRASDPAQN